MAAHPIYSRSAVVGVAKPFLNSSCGFNYEDRHSSTQLLAVVRLLHENDQL